MTGLRGDRSQGDDGLPDAQLVAALVRWRGGADDAARTRVLAALVQARVFIPVTARAVDVAPAEQTGLAADRTTEMALLTLEHSDGRRALPVFSDGHAVQRWQAQARPVPVTGPDACRAALENACVAVLLDPHEAQLAVQPAELTEVAAGRVPVPGAALSTHVAAGALTPLDEPPDPELLAALARALAGEPVRSARLLRGPAGLVLGVTPRKPLDPAGLAELARRVATRLGSRLPDDGLDLAVVPPDVRGHDVRIGGGWFRRG